MRAPRRGSFSRSRLTILLLVVMCLSLTCLHEDCDDDSTPAGPGGGTTPPPRSANEFWWESTETPNTYLYDVFALDDGHAFVGGLRGIYSYDGQVWEDISSPSWRNVAAVIAFAENDVWAGAISGLHRYDGSTWTKIPDSPEFTVHYSNALWGTGPSDIYAAADAPGTDTRNLYHYDGSAWTVVRSGAEFLSVWGVAGHVFAGAAGGRVDHFDGAAWSTTQITNGSPVWSFWGPSPSDVFAGASDIFHFDGTGWTAIFDAPGNVYSLWGRSGSEVYAVGNRGFSHRYDGNSWQPFGGLEGHDIPTLWSVMGSPSGSLYAAGERGLSSRVERKGLFLELGPQEWQEPRSVTRNDLGGIWAAAEDDIIAAGAGNTILRYDGTGWAHEVPPAVGSDVSYTGVWGSAPNDVWAVGIAGANQAIAVHYDGSAWAAEAVPPVGGLVAIHGTGPDDVYAVGTGVILRYDGTSWSNQFQPFATYNDVWSYAGGGDHQVYVTRSGPSVRHFDDGQWTDLIPFQGIGEVGYFAVGGAEKIPGIHAVWIVGGKSTYFRVTTGDWFSYNDSEIPVTGSANALWSVEAPGGNFAYMSTIQGSARYDAVAGDWEEGHVHGGFVITDICGIPGTNRAFAVGQGGILLVARE